MSFPFKITRRVEFHDTDMAGIMHFTAYFRFMEVAEHDFLRDLGLSVVMPDADGELNWPRVSAHCDFTGPARYEDELDIEVRVARLGSRSVTFEFRFTHQGRQIALGNMTSVCCRFTPAGQPKSIAIPEAIRAKLAPFYSKENDS